MIQVKRTATYKLRGEYETRPGYPANLSSSTVTCDVELSDGQYKSVAVDIDPDNLRFTLTADTQHWTLGVGQSDLRFTENGLVWFTETFDIEVVPNITRQ